MTDREEAPVHADVSPEAAQAALQKVLASPHFSNARRLSEFLRFISAKAAAGEAGRITDSLIAMEVYGRDPDYDPTVDSIVRVEANRLRARLRDYYEAEGRDDPVRLRLPGDSYTPVFESAPAMGAREAPRRHVPRRTSPGAVVAAILVALSTMVALVAFSRRARDPRSSIAVLPFGNTGGLGSKDYFSDGLTERITNRLGRTGKLQVVGRRSAEQLKDRGGDVREIGMRLGVDLVVKGRVRFSADRIGIEAALYDSHDGRQVWSREFDRPAAEASTLQDDVSQALLQTLQLSQKGDSLGWTNDSEALDLYLQARYLFNSRKLDNLWKSVQLYEAAVKKDPRFALAYAGLAEDYVVLGTNEDQDLSETIPLARQAVTRALALDPNLPEALLTEAATADHPNFETLERQYRAAIAANPSSPNAHHWWGLNLLAAGRFAEAENEIRRAQLLDPLSLYIGVHIGTVYYCSRRYQEAIDQERRILDLDPHVRRAMAVSARAYEGLGRYAEAEGMLENLRKTNDSPNAMADLGHVYAVSGKKELARRMLETLTSLSKKRHVPPHYLALIQAGLGNNSEALALLDISYEQHEAPLALLRVDPRWDPLRGDPRFQQLLHILNLDR